MQVDTKSLSTDKEDGLTDKEDGLVLKRPGIHDLQACYEAQVF